MTFFGGTIKELRQKRQLTVKSVSEAVGIPESRLSEMERGVRLPTDGQIQRLESFFALKTNTLRAKPEKA